MKASVRILNIHLSGRKLVLMRDRSDGLENADMPSPLKRYLGRPVGSSIDQLTYLDYYARYSVDAHPMSADLHPDICLPVRFANQRKDPIYALSIQFIGSIRSHLP
jgi:hypothetical protein